uniref:dolichol kinase n=1 Tax=Panagrellus redivivus TaxID=6233 RepID=A0A7E4UZP7_PANRE
MVYEDATFLDEPLIVASWTATVSLVIVGIGLCSDRRLSRVSVAPVWLNVALAGVVGFAALLVGVWTGVGFQLPYWLFRRVWSGTLNNACLQLFFLIQLLGSILYCVHRTSPTTHATSTQRKFFHFTISMIAIAGLFFDPAFTRLAAHLMLQIFVILELLRSLSVYPWADILNPALIGFIDTAQESERFIATPLLLISGIFLPLFLSPVNPTTAPLRLCHFAGVATVGIGDSFAAIAGSSWGRTRLWYPFITRKSLEGSLAMFLGQGAFYGILLASGAVEPWALASLLRVFVASIVCTGIEAALPIGDNLVLPIVAWFILD